MATQYGYLSGQGKVYTALKGADGLPLDFLFRGNIPNFELAINIDTLEHKESTSGQRQTDLILQTGKKVELNLNLQSFSPENKALLTQGRVVSQGAGSVSAFQLNGGAALVDGKTYAVQDKDISSLVLTDSTGSPLTMALGTNYTANLPFGMITAVGSQSGFVAPIKAAYTKKTAQKSVGILTEAPSIQWIRFLAVNTAWLTVSGAFKRFCVDLFNVQFNALQTMGLIQDELADFETTANVLVDPTRDPAQDGGQLGVITWIDD